MSPQNALADVLDAAETFDDEGQLELTTLVQRRLAERGLERVAGSVSAARQEYVAGNCPPMSATDILAGSSAN